jgi:hypothetical protein
MMEFWIECRIPKSHVRQDFLIQTALEMAADVRSILMLLDDLRVDAVAQKLRKRGRGVTTNHKLFPNEKREKPSRTAVPESAVGLRSRSRAR